MTRECNTDFKAIKKYIDGYRISDNLHNVDYVLSLKKMHKCYFSSITWNAELLHKKIDFLNLETSCNEDTILRLSEVASDLGSSLFNWSNGNYKASRVMLRIAIENIIRAISATEDNGQLTEKNVYKLFDNASSQQIFNSDKNINDCYKSLHSDYKLLCEDTHTATVDNMEHLTSLSDLPTYEKERSDSSSTIFIRVSKNITSMLCIIFNTFYHRMHHRNKENILHCLNKAIKPAITAPEG